MAKFPKLRLTKQVIKALQTSIERSGVRTLLFDIAYIQLGDGRLPNNANIEDMTELINKKQTVQITSANANPLEGTIKITAINDNKTLDEGYYLREIGVFGYDYNNKLILIAYANAGDECDYIPDKSTPIDEQIFNIKFAIGNTDNLKITVKDDAVVTIKQFRAHIKDPNAHSSIFSKLKEWIKEIFATKAELKNHEDYAEQTYLKTKDLPAIDFSPYLEKSDAEYEYLKKTDASNTYLTKYDATEKYQPKGDYISESTANYRFLREYNFKDKLLEVLGVRYSIEQNGYICFGPLFGGLIIQWGICKNLPYQEGNYTTVTFPVNFKSDVIIPFAIVNYRMESRQGNNDFYLGVAYLTKENFALTLEAATSSYNTEHCAAYWIAIGR